MDFDTLYRRYIAYGMSEERARSLAEATAALYASPEAGPQAVAPEGESRGALQEFGRGAALGLTEAGTSTAQGIGWLGRKAAELVPGEGPVERMFTGLERGAGRIEDRAEEILDPRGRAGTIGRFTGRIGGEIAATGATLGLGKLGLARYAPRGLEAVQALTKGSRLRSALGAAAAEAPLSFARAGGEAAEGRSFLTELGLELGGGAIGGALMSGRAAARAADEVAEEVAEEAASAAGREVEIELPRTTPEPTAQEVLDAAAARAPGEPLIAAPVTYTPRSRQKQAARMRTMRESEEAVRQAPRAREETRLIDERAQELEAQQRAADLRTQEPGGIYIPQPRRPVTGYERDVRQLMLDAQRAVNDLRIAGREVPEELAKQADDLAVEAVESVPDIVQKSTASELVDIVSPFAKRSPERERLAARVFSEIESQRRLSRIGAQKAEEFQSELNRRAVAMESARRSEDIAEAATEAADIEGRLLRAGEAGAEEAAKRAAGRRGLELYSFPGPAIQSAMQSAVGRAALGAVAGGTVGGVTSEEDPLGGALGGAIIGAGLPAGYRAFAKVAGNVSSSPDDVVLSARNNIFSRRRRAQRPVVEGGPVPSVARGLDDETITEFRARQYGYEPTSLSELEKQAASLDIADVYTKFRSNQRLNNVELKAAAGELERLNNDWKIISDQIDALEGMGQDASKLREALDVVQQRRLPVVQMVSNTGSEGGLTLQLMKQVFRESGLAENAQFRRMVMSTLGVKRLKPELQDALDMALSIPDRDKKIAALSQFVIDNRKTPKIDIVFDIRRAGLLSRVATWVRNIAGSVENFTGEFIESPIANALDNVYSSVTGNQRVFADMSALQRGGAILQGLAAGAKEVLGNFSAYAKGLDPEDPLSSINRRVIKYENLFGENSPELIKSGLRGIQKINNTIYGLIAAGDRPFYRAGFNVSVRERAMMRALSDDAVLDGTVRVGSDEFNNIVKRFLDPANMRNEDLILATYDALDATYKSPTALGDVVRAARRQGGVASAIAQLTVPFASSPTNIVRKALERVPGVGLFSGAGYRRALERHVSQMRAAGMGKITEQAVDRQLRRMYSKLFAKQITGSGLLLAGYALYNNGNLTLPYTPPIGASEGEREAARRRGLTGEGSLSLKFGDRTYDLGATLGTVAPVLALGAAWAAAEEDFEEGPMLNNLFSGLSAAGGSLGQTVLSLPLLSGTKDVVESLGGGGMTKPAAAGRQAATFIPFSAALGGVTRAFDQEVGSRVPETFIEGATMNIPGLAEQVPPRVTALGEVLPGPGPISSLVQPFTERKIATGPLYDILEDIGWSPLAPRKLEGETGMEYAERRQREGEMEREYLMQSYNELVQGGYINPETLAEDEAQMELAKNTLSRILSRVRSANTRIRQYEQMQRETPR